MIEDKRWRRLLVPWNYGDCWGRRENDSIRKIGYVWA